MTTRKILLVGHSQGALYSNALYDYLLAHGEPREAVGVYQVASPASYVAGGGKHLNSSGDTLLGALRGLGVKLLPDNIDLAWSSADARAEFPGHSFSGAYLAEAPDRIVGDIRSALKKLEPKWASDTAECFSAPDSGLGYQAAKAGFAVADTAAVGLKAGAGAAGRVAVITGNALASAVQGVYGVADKLVADIGITVGGIGGISHAAEPSKTPTNFDIFSRIYGSSISKEEYKDLVGDMGGAVATAPILAPASQPEPATLPVPEAVTRPASAPQANGFLSISHIIPLLSGSGGARHHRPSSDAPEPEAPAAAPVTDAVPVAQDGATATEPAATTTPPSEGAASTPEAVPASEAPAYSLAFEDSFDAYESQGWQTPGVIFSGTLIPFEAEPAESGACHSGSCIAAKGGSGGLGTLSHRPYIVKEIGGSPSGFLTVWAKRHDVLHPVSANIVTCVTGTGCSSSYMNYLPVPNDNEWHQYFFAWKPGPESVQLCVQTDSADMGSCAWSGLGGSGPTDTFDMVGLTGFAPRPDYGDTLLFDDISVSLQR